MRYWVFHEEALAAELARREAELVANGETVEQAKFETGVIVSFLAGAVSLQGGRRA